MFARQAPITCVGSVGEWDGALVADVRGGGMFLLTFGIQRKALASAGQYTLGLGGNQFLEAIPRGWH